MRELSRFRDERNWRKFHTPKNLAISISIEAGELLEIFQWIDDRESFRVIDENKDRIADEIADIMIYCLYLSDILGLHPEKIILDKIEKNKNRFPTYMMDGKRNRYETESDH